MHEDMRLRMREASGCMHQWIKNNTFSLSKDTRIQVTISFLLHVFVHIELLPIYNVVPPLVVYLSCRWMLTLYNSRVSFTLRVRNRNRSSISISPHQYRVESG